MYRGELEKLSNVYTTAELRKIKSELNIHCLSKSFQEQIKILNLASSNKEVSTRENTREEAEQPHEQQSIERQPSLQTIFKAFIERLRTFRNIKNSTPSNRL